MENKEETGNNIETLRTHLFDTIKGLKDKENPMEIDRAKAICEVSQAIINSAKVEVDHMKVSGSTGTKFLDQKPSVPGLTVHKIK